MHCSLEASLIKGGTSVSGRIWSALRHTVFLRVCLFGGLLILESAVAQHKGLNTSNYEAAIWGMLDRLSFSA